MVAVARTLWLALLGLAASQPGCRDEAPAERALDCGDEAGAAAMWLGTQLLGANVNASGSEATKAFRDHVLAWRVDAAFRPWCTAEAARVVGAGCFATAKAPPASCAPVRAALLDHRVTGNACAELIARVAPLVRAVEDVGAAAAFTEERAASVRAAVARYAAWEKHDALRVCEQLGGVRVRCTTGGTDPDCAELRAALRAPR